MRRRSDRLPLSDAGKTSRGSEAPRRRRSVRCHPPWLKIRPAAEEQLVAQPRAVQPRGRVPTAAEQPSFARLRQCCRTRSHRTPARAGAPHADTRFAVGREGRRGVRTGSSGRKREERNVGLALAAGWKRAVSGYSAGGRVYRRLVLSPFLSLSLPHHDFFLHSLDSAG